MNGWIYFSRYGAEGPIKIGRAADPRRRVAGLNTASPVQLLLLGAMPSTQAVEEEAELHCRLRAHNVRGEWFEAEAVLEEMKRLDSRLVVAEQVEARHLDTPWLRSVPVHIRVKPEEVRLWRAAADAQNKSLSEWIRDRCQEFCGTEDEEGLP